MAKKPQPVQMPQPESNVLVIPAITKVAMGHIPHRSGNGIHGDKRLKRHKTRQQQNRAAMSGW